MPRIGTLSPVIGMLTGILASIGVSFRIGRVPPEFGAVPVMGAPSAMGDRPVLVLVGLRPGMRLPRSPPAPEEVPGV